MDSFKTLCFLVLLGLVAVAWSQELREEDLAAAEFEDLEVDFEDSDEEGSEARGLLKNSKNKDRCTCPERNKCGCCARPRIIGYKVQGCLNFTLYTEEKKLLVALVAMDNQIAQYNFSIQPVDRICDRMPGKLSFLKFCLYTNTTENEEVGLRSCTSLDIIFKNTTAAIIKFSCITFNDGKLDFEANQEVDRETMLKVKVKNPIKAIKELFKRGGGDNAE